MRIYEDKLGAWTKLKEGVLTLASNSNYLYVSKNKLKPYAKLLAGTCLVTSKFVHCVYVETKELFIHVEDIANVIAGKSM
jgi:hypothetical protein